MISEEESMSLHVFLATVVVGPSWGQMLTKAAVMLNRGREEINQGPISQDRSHVMGCKAKAKARHGSKSKERCCLLAPSQLKLGHSWEAKLQHAVAAPEDRRPR